MSLSTLRFIFDIVPSLQAWQSQQFLEALLEDDQAVTVNPTLSKWIPLDAVKQALEQLPALADAEFERSWPRIDRLIKRQVKTIPFEEARQKMPTVLVQGVTEAGLSAFIPARKYYGVFREGRESITAYIRQAKVDLTLVSVNLMTGDSLESILETFDEMMHRDSRVKITLSLLDPDRDYLMKSVAGNLGMTGEQLAEAIHKLIDKVTLFHRGLAPHIQDRFTLCCHATLPSASAILVDSSSDRGVIQLETKAYRSPTIEAFGFEVSHGTAFYRTLRKSYLDLVRDGRKVL